MLLCVLNLWLVLLDYPLVLPCQHGSLVQRRILLIGFGDGVSIVVRVVAWFLQLAGHTDNVKVLLRRRSIVLKRSLLRVSQPSASILGVVQI